MGYLSGLQNYLKEHYSLSIYDQALQSRKEFTFHAHDHQIFNGKISQNDRYEIVIENAGVAPKVLPKTDIKFIYQSTIQANIEKVIAIDPKISNKKIKPILCAAKRNFVKNKSLYALLKERKVLFFYLLEGEVIKGIVSEFSRYEITVNLKGKEPVTIFRHAILKITDKKKRSYMKEFQQKAKDWKKSPLYVDDGGVE